MEGAAFYELGIIHQDEGCLKGRAKDSAFKFSSLLWTISFTY